MATRGEIGWQSDKTLAQCLRYMLDNEIATDVCFEVGPPDGATIKLRAHKYMLIARSEVFEAMFSSGMTECRSGVEAKIRVEDIDADVFKSLLKYIYCEIVSVNVETAASLLYAAKKYMLPKLARECAKCLSKNIKVNNVTQILEQSLLFNDTELKNKCLKLIGQNANAVLAGTEIKSASPKTLGAILEINKLPVHEIIIYDTCMAWAKHQLQLQRSNDNPTDQQIRDILGDLLYKIRFPTMNPIEFAAIVEGKTVLTAEEKESVYYFLVTKKKGSKLMFPTEWRMCEEVWIDRTVISGSGEWKAMQMGDAIDFQTNRDIMLTGVGLYTGYDESGYDVDIEICQSTNSLFKKRITVPFTEHSTPFKISLNEPILIKAQVVHSVKTFPYDSIGHYGYTCQAVCTKENVTITFSSNANSSYTGVGYGQIPRFYFYSTQRVQQ